MDTSMRATLTNVAAFGGVCLVVVSTVVLRSFRQSSPIKCVCERERERIHWQGNTSTVTHTHTQNLPSSYHFWPLVVVLANVHLGPKSPIDSVPTYFLNKLSIYLINLPHLNRWSNSISSCKNLGGFYYIHCNSAADKPAICTHCSHCFASFWSTLS